MDSSQPEQKPSLSCSEEEQEMQAPGPGPEQVEQEGWQVVQVAESASLYWPRGQVGKQVPLARS